MKSEIGTLDITYSIKMAQTMNYTQKYATVATGALLNDNIITDDQQTKVLETLNRVFASLETEVSKLLEKQKQKKKSKSRKSHKKSAYRVFVEQNKAQIKDTCAKGEKFMTKAGELWKALSDDDKLPYQNLADEFNAKLPNKSVETSEVAAPIIPDATEMTDLTGPYEGTYISGSFGRKSYKTLGEAYMVLKNNPHAVGITRTTKGQFKIRAGYSKPHMNVDKNGDATPQFVYRSPGDESSWVLKTAIEEYASQGPYTKKKQFQCKTIVEETENELELTDNSSTQSDGENTDSSSE